MRTPTDNVSDTNDGGQVKIRVDRKATSCLHVPSWFMSPIFSLSRSGSQESSAISISGGGIPSRENASPKPPSSEIASVAISWRGPACRSSFRSNLTSMSRGERGGVGKIGSPADDSLLRIGFDVVMTTSVNGTGAKRGYASRAGSSSWGAFQRRETRPVDNEALTVISARENSPQMPFRMFFSTCQVRAFPFHPDRNLFRTFAPAAL